VWSGPGYGFRVTFLLPLALRAELRILGDLLAFLVQSWADFHKLGETSTFCQ